MNAFLLRSMAVAVWLQTLACMNMLHKPVNEHVVTEQRSEDMMPLSSGLFLVAAQSKQCRKEQVKTKFERKIRHSVGPILIYLYTI